MEIIVAGKNSKFIKSIFQNSALDKFIYEQNSTETLELSFIDRKKFWELRKEQIMKDSWLVIVLYPQSATVDDKIFKKAKHCFDNRVVVLSSVASLFKCTKYKYVRQKIFREALAFIFGFSVLRAGYPSRSFYQSNSNISPVVPVTDRDLFLKGLLCSVNKKKALVNCFELLQQEKRYSSSSVISFFYGALVQAFGNQTHWLRPIDFVLKKTGYLGYGYSYWSKKDAMKISKFSKSIYKQNFE